MSAKRKTKTKKTKQNQNREELPLEVEIGLILLLGFSVFLFISNFGIGGRVGKIMSQIGFGIFGYMAYLFPVFFFIGCIFCVANRKDLVALAKMLCAVIGFVLLCGFVALVADGSDVPTVKEAFDIGFTSRSGGGAIGTGYAKALVPNVGLVGAYLVDVVGIAICAVFLTERSLYAILRKQGRAMREEGKRTSARFEESKEMHRQKRQARLAAKALEEEEENAKLRRNKVVSGVAFDTLVTPEESHSDEMTEVHSDSIAEKPLEIHTMDSEPITESVVEPARQPQKTKRVKEKVPEIVKEEPKKKEPEKTEPAITISTGEGKDDYEFPPLSLLKAGDPKKKGDSKESLRNTALQLEQTLSNFGVNVTVTNVSCGPSVTRFELQPEQGVKVSKIVGLADDIKLNLAAADIRIEAPIPGKAAVGIEVPNKENVTVMLRELLESQEFQKAKTKMPFSAGKDIGGQVIVSDIGKMPHVLIAGATGSGKSVCINTIVMSILYKARPDEVKLIMIDPKVVELSVYNGIPHLLIPVVTDPKKAAGALNWAVVEMTDRYQKFAESNVRDLKGYNAHVESYNREHPDTKLAKMPQIVIIVDELADLMMVAPGDVEDAICRLAQLARAAGIHLILATQRPSVNVITGLIKANMPSRVAFAVSSGVDSRTILDMNGAEKLLGKGDMLFYPQGYQKPLRVQGAFVSDEEVAAVVEFLKERCQSVTQSDEASNEIEEKVNAISLNGKSGVQTPGAATDDGRDVYFVDAGRLIVEKERGSIGMLQRMFKIGFNRAARIMDQLEEAGVVGPEEGTKARKILVTKEEFEAMMKEE
ncbi:DNA segregation ATPase FtsK/SpoIIIE, S-DNA-T family [Lachnospiraceae bacterium XBB1006]|nr:DNA segregation ATPase FtsK/SpoIIIE, S-DNA-T family [Lachnospiraceae bacterium XBB1006]